MNAEDLKNALYQIDHTQMKFDIKNARNNVSQRFLTNVPTKENLGETGAYSNIG